MPLAAGLVRGFNVDCLDKLPQRIRGKLIQVLVFAYPLDKLLQVFNLSFLYFDFLLQSLNFHFKLCLFVLIGLAHHRELFICDAPRHISSEEVARKLYPATSMGQQYSMPDYEWVHKEMQKSGVTLSLLWVEYCERCRQNGELPYKSTQFNKYYADYVHKTKATMHLEHKPGENLQVDWAGQTAGITDTDTGERLPAYLFVAVLPYSGYAYTEAFLDMKQEAWITAHVHAYNYFGGVTRILTPDNLKTGVIKNTRTETVLNKAYQEMAEHYGTAIIPTRPRTPKDKAFVEGSVGVVSTWILAALRNRQFLSLDELNRAIWENLVNFNHKPFQKKDGSRASDFEEEKLFLLPLPPNPFELAE